MSTNTCPRCAKVLPENVLREVARGTSCPFCTAPLKRSPRRSLDTPPAADEGYATFEVDRSIPVNTTPPPSLKPAAAVALKPVPSPRASVTPLKPALKAPTPAAPSKPAPGPVAMPKGLRSTMVGAALAQRELSFDATPSPAPMTQSGPVIVPRGPAPRLPAAPPPAPAKAAEAPARVSAMAATMLATPASSRLPLPGSVPPPPANSAVVTPLVATMDSEPTHVAPSRSSGTVAPLVATMDSEPTHVAPPREPAPVAFIAPVLGGNESEPIATVTITPDSAPIIAPATLQPVQPRRGLALLGVGMGLGIVVLAFAGFKLLSGPKAVAPAAPPQVAVAAAEPAPPPAPAVEAIPSPSPAAVAPPAPAAKARPEKAPPPKASPPVVAERPADAAPPAHEKRARHEKRDKHASRQSSHRAKAHRRHTPRGHKVAMQSPSAKRSAPPPPPERTDPRPAYERGNALLLAGDGKAAISAYREAVKSSPSDPIGFRGLGLAYEQQGETAAAIRALKRYLKLAPDAADHELIAKRINRLSSHAKK